MDYKKIVIFILALMLLCSVTINVWMFVIFQKNNTEKIKEESFYRILAFRNMFTENVLLSEKEVDFDTRLAMETAIRNLNDAEIFDQWQKFTKSETKEEAIVQAKKLLNLLIVKTSK